MADLKESYHATSGGWRSFNTGNVIPYGDDGSDPDGWQIMYSSTFTSNDGWVARQETQANDNSYNHPDNVEYGPGGLVIHGRREERGGRPYTSGDVTGQHIVVPNYFRAEVVATLPTDYGMWPAPLWFRPLNSPHGEIDVCETWPYTWPAARFAVALHRDYSLSPRQVNAPLNYSMLPNPDPTAPHTYTVIKTQNRIEFLCDGVRAYCWEGTTPWNGTQRIGPLPEWYADYFEVPERIWYPRVTLQIGGTETPEPNPEWQHSELIIHSLKIYEQEN